MPKEPLRIAVVTETYPPEVNGVARTMGQMVEALHARGHCIELTRPAQSHDTDRGRRDAAGFTEHLVHGIPIPCYSELRMGAAWPRTLGERWRDRRPDVVHIVTEGPLGWAALLAARRAGIPVSSGFHTNFEAYSRHYGIGVLSGAVDGMLRSLHNRCDATIVPTAEMRRSLEARGYERLAVVGRGIDTALFCPERRSASLRNAWGCEADEPVVLHVGRLAPEKNLALFVRAALAVTQLRPRTRVVLVGDGPEAAALRAAHPGFVFAGTRRGEDLAAHYASADLFLFPSVTETFGNVTTEALASGLAVAAYDYAAAREHIVDGESGLLAPLGDAEAFVEAARTLVRSPQTVARLRRGAAVVGRRMGWGKVIDELERVLRGVAQSVPGHSAASPADLPKPETTLASGPYWYWF